MYNCLFVYHVWRCFISEVTFSRKRFLLQMNFEIHGDRYFVPDNKKSKFLNFGLKQSTYNQFLQNDKRLKTAAFDSFCVVKTWCFFLKREGEKMFFFSCTNFIFLEIFDKVVGFCCCLMVLSKKQRTKTFSWVGDNISLFWNRKRANGDRFHLLFWDMNHKWWFMQTKQEKKHLFPCLFKFVTFWVQKKKKKSKIDRNFQTFVQCCFVQRFPNFVLFSVKRSETAKKKFCGLATFFF